VLEAVDVRHVAAIAERRELCSADLKRASCGAGRWSCEMKYSCAIIHSDESLVAFQGFSIELGQMICRVSKMSTCVPFLV
jgi:hypothetical protein